MSRRPFVARPARLVASAFAMATVVGTVLLALPVSSRRGSIPPIDALFTATSAVCVTGLTVLDTGTTWSTFGVVVIVVLAQVGGLGIMTLATLIALILSRRLGMRSRSMAQAETGAVPSGELRRVLIGVAVSALVVEAVVAVALATRFWLIDRGNPLGAVGDGVFYAVMAFNNAGFGLRPDNLTAYVTDWWVNVPIMVAVVIGGLGFPVLIDLTRRRRRPWRLSLHTRLTIAVTAILLVVGALTVLAFEWGNPGTLGPLAVPDKLLASSFASVSARTAGFNTVDIGAMRETTWLFTDFLMFVGSGSASTGGGIKVTTLAVLVLVSVAEVRGERDVTWRDRMLPDVVVRQALAVTLIALAVVGAVTTFLLARQPAFTLDRVLFEVLSAFGTVGLSTGITPLLDDPSKLVLAALMFFGRVGPVTLAAAFVLRTHDRLYQLPEERPLVG